MGLHVISRKSSYSGERTVGMEAPRVNRKSPWRTCAPAAAGGGLGPRRSPWRLHDPAERRGDIKYALRVRHLQALKLHL